MRERRGGQPPAGQVRRLRLAAEGDPDQVPRLERFRAAHPEWVIKLDGFWEARRAGDDTGRSAVSKYWLRDLLDQLEQMYPPCFTQPVIRRNQSDSPGSFRRHVISTESGSKYG